MLTSKVLCACLQEPAAETLLLLLLKALSSDFFAHPKSRHHKQQQQQQQKTKAASAQQQEKKLGDALIPQLQQKEQRGGALTQQQVHQLSVAAKQTALGLWHTVAEISRKRMQERLAQPVRASLCIRNHTLNDAQLYTVQWCTSTQKLYCILCSSALVHNRCTVHLSQYAV